jgi:KipI family sensor histidine kinase inhibitor
MPEARPVGGEPTIEPLGDAALLVVFGTRVAPELATRAAALAAALESARHAAPSIGRPVPAHASVLVPFDPLAIELDDAIGIVRWALASAGAAPTAPGIDMAAAPIEIPVRYGGADGPDLDAVADLHDLRPADVVELHASATYDVRFLGFAPGFAYLGGLPPVLASPRRPSPRERVPSGSVGIAGEQTGVYPIAMPGGWQLIGRTEVVLFDPDDDPPALLQPGATVRFVPVTDR